MKDKQWYAATIKENIGPFKADEIAYVRKLILKIPLAVGPVVILFNPKQKKSMRLAESVGLCTVYAMWPNNVVPKPAPAELNELIEVAYRKFLEKNPITPRWNKNV